MSKKRESTSGGWDEDSESDDTSNPFRDNSSGPSGKRSRQSISIKDKAGEDVFGVIQQPESSTSASKGPTPKIKLKLRLSGNGLGNGNGNVNGKGNVSDGDDEGGGAGGISFLTVNNNIPLLDPGASDTDQENGASPNPQPEPKPYVPVLEKKSKRKYLVAIEAPALPRVVLEQYKYLGPHPPPTPATTIPEDRTRSTSRSEGGNYFKDEARAGPSRYRDPDEDDQSEDRTEDDIPPFPPPRLDPSSSRSPIRPGNLRQGIDDSGHSSSDPIGQDWESGAGASEGVQAGDEDEDDYRDTSALRGGGGGRGDENEDEEEIEEMEGIESEDDDMEDEDGDDDDVAHEGTPRKKKSLRGYDERREATKLVLKRRLRGAPISANQVSFSRDIFNFL